MLAGLAVFGNKIIFQSHIFITVFEIVFTFTKLFSLLYTYVVCMFKLYMQYKIYILRLGSKWSNETFGNVLGVYYNDTSYFFPGSKESRNVLCSTSIHWKFNTQLVRFTKGHAKNFSVVRLSISRMSKWEWRNIYQRDFFVILLKKSNSTWHRFQIQRFAISIHSCLDWHIQLWYQSFFIIC